ncbi:hypothetical protein RchiOBHm_Chr1g0324221 [Rosa chinensis]|uniref:Uncharacterized protein n=1 Tax=Rosa chinensis TaxID=74649 RepID=A0A2P6S9S3_ROSCH|nr:hypothetical protein RchiOBHm_Chr1g0324221 [Rosa chinensis]
MILFFPNLLCTFCTCGRQRNCKMYLLQIISSNRIWLRISLMQTYRQDFIIEKDLFVFNFLVFRIFLFQTCNRYNHDILCFI